MTITDCLGVLFVLMILQVLGAHLQVKQYRKTVSKLHKLGNIGVGSNRRRFGAGSIIIISCKSDGMITGAEEMRGFTIFSTFKEVPELVGRTIYDLKAEYSSLPEKQRDKLYKAHLQAIEALEIRLHNEAAKKQLASTETVEETSV